MLRFSGCLLDILVIGSTLDVLSPRSLVSYVFIRTYIQYIHVQVQFPNFVSTKFHATQHRICSKTLLT